MRDSRHLGREDAALRLQRLLDAHLVTEAGDPIYLKYILDSASGVMPDFLTLDEGFGRSIEGLESRLRGYTSDASILRPLNVLLIAKPGSGKSHFVNCLGKALKAPVVTGNLSAYDPLDVMQVVLNEARNHKAVDRLPMLFLDEVDCRFDQLAHLLPVLWDGSFLLEDRVSR